MVLTAFPPVANDDVHTLILGSMPGIASLQEQRYYAHPRNAFWPIMARCLTPEFATQTATRRDPEELTDEDYHAQLAVLQKNKIALWDVLKHCERAGSLDSNIVESSVECNDFPRFLERYGKINTILFNGKTAERLFRKHMAKALHDDADSAPTLLCLPSTSPAMAALNFEQKLELWRNALEQAGVNTPATS